MEISLKIYTSDTRVIFFGLSDYMETIVEILINYHFKKSKK